MQSISKLTLLKSYQQQIMKKALREMQTLHAGCSKAEPKILPRRRPP